jgi:two-component system response regulator
MSHAVLLVDDSPEDVQLILHALQKAVPRDQVAVSNSGEDALDFLFARNAHAAREGAEQPRIILLDLNLPRMPGLEVLRQLRANDATRMLPVVVISASVEQRDIRNAMNTGANSYVRKSLDFARLSDAITLMAHYWLELNISPPSGAHFD